MAKILKNDEVIIIAGKDKGKKGLVKDRINENYLIIDGLNLAKKAQKPNPATGSLGGIINISKPIHISNVAVINSATGKADRVGFKFVDGKKVRIFKSNSEVIGV